MELILGVLHAALNALRMTATLFRPPAAWRPSSGASSGLRPSPPRLRLAIMGGGSSTLDTLPALSGTGTTDTTDELVDGIGEWLAVVPVDATLCAGERPYENAGVGGSPPSIEPHALARLGWCGCADSGVLDAVDGRVTRNAAGFGNLGVASSTKSSAHAIEKRCDVAGEGTGTRSPRASVAIRFGGSESGNTERNHESYVAVSTSVSMRGCCGSATLAAMVDDEATGGDEDTTGDDG